VKHLVRQRGEIIKRSGHWKNHREEHLRSKKEPSIRLKLRKNQEMGSEGRLEA
jgi:hypothetical protein